LQIGTNLVHFGMEDRLKTDPLQLVLRTIVSRLVLSLAHVFRASNRHLEDGLRVEPWRRMLKRFLRILRPLPVLAATLGLVGCNHFFGHDDQVQDPLTVKDQGLSCVRTVGPDLKLFFAGQDRDPVRIVDCLSSALTKFSENTRGANPDGWTRGELSSFFETYFKEESATSTKIASEKINLDGSKRSTVSDEALVTPFDGDWIAQARRRAVVTELFRWKAVLLGGGDATLSRDEMNRIRDLLKKAREPLAVWRGQGLLLSMKSSFSGESADIAKLDRVAASIRAVAELVASELSVGLKKSANGKPPQPRDPMNLQTLSSSLELAGIKVLESPDRQKLVQVVKSVVLSGDPQQIGGDEWSELVRQASELWIGALRIQYGIAQNTSAYDRDLDFVELTVRDLTKSVGRMVDRHGGRIDNEQVRRLISQLEVNGLLPAIVKAKTVNASLDVIFGKLLGGNSKVNRADLALGLQHHQLERINNVVHDWTEGQRVTLAIVGGSQYVTIDRARVAMSQIATKSKDAVGEDVRQQMTELVLRGRPLVSDASGRLMIVPMENIQGFQRSDLETLNITRVLMSAAMQAYSHESVRAGSMPQITEGEIQELFMDLKALGRDLGIVDVRSLQSGIRTFMEANIFLSVSDGNEFISLHEMVEWFETVMSAGRVADQIHAELTAEDGRTRCGTTPTDVFGKNRIAAQCFRENWVPVFRKNFSHLPNFIRALDVAEKTKTTTDFMTALQGATRALGPSDLPIESSDVRVMSPVIHYAEALFARYDANRSSNLETAEVWSVYPLIRPFIQKLAVDADGKPIQLNAAYERAIFSWLLVEGEPPTTSFWGKLDLFAHRWTMFARSEEAGFGDIIKILASFQKVGRAKKNRDMAKFYIENAQAWEMGLSRGDKKMMEKTRDLLQCANEADGDLWRLVQARKRDIFLTRPGVENSEPVPEYLVDTKSDVNDQATEFVNRFKAMVQSDPNLQLLCMAF
jgi:hypothetical protein